MRLLNIDEVTDIVERTRILQPLDLQLTTDCGIAFDSGSAHKLRETPVDSGKKVALSRYFARSYFEPDEDLLIVFSNTDVWPSGSLPFLVDQLRFPNGSQYSLIDLPGQVCSQAEQDMSISLIFLALSFYWDCFVAGLTSCRVVFCSHDEFYALAAQDRPFVELASNTLDKLKL